MQVTNEEFTRQEEEYNQLNEHAWFEEINQIIQMKIKEICNSKLSLYKLFKFICEISNGTAFLKLTKNERNEEKSKRISPCSITFLFSLNSIELTHRTPQSTTRHRCIELTLPPNQLGYLLGRNGHLHKQIMLETGTQIHFQNAPYSSNVKPHRCPEFNLDLLQSTSLLKVKITGDTDEAIDNAVHALEQLDRDTQVRLILLIKLNHLSGFFLDSSCSWTWIITTIVFQE